MADQVAQARSLPLGIRALMFTRDWGILVLLVGVVTFFTALNGTAFFSYDNALLVLNAAAITSIFAAGVAISAMGGVLDLSIPGTAAIAGVIAARIVFAGNKLGEGGVAASAGRITLALFCGLVAGVAVGLFNGAVTLRGFNPLIVTIGTLSILQGVSSVIARGYTIPGLDMLSFMGTRAYFGRLAIPAPVIVTAIVYLLATTFLSKTRNGIRLTAVGGNAEAARRVGINSYRYKLLGFVLCGVFAALGGLVQTAYVTEANPFPTVGVVFDALTAVALGGISLEGGRGRLSKVLMGAVVLATISDGLVISGVGNYWAYVATGALLLGALILERSVGAAIAKRLLTKDLTVDSLLQDRKK